MPPMPDTRASGRAAANAIYGQTMSEIAAAPASGASEKARDRIGFFFLNLGHLYDHMFMLIFATVVVALVGMDGMSYGELLKLATPAFVLFGLGSLPAGWLADRWSRQGMITVFFIGIGASSILTGLATSTWQIALGLGAIGLFASIYHPVGIAMVVDGREKVGKALGINGVWGNMGVAAAPLVAGYLVQTADWRTAFIVPGIVSVVTGMAYIVFCRDSARRPKTAKPQVADPHDSDLTKAVLIRVAFALTLTILFGGIVFHSVAIALPKLYAERLASLTTDLANIGVIVALIVGVASFAQIVVGHLVDRFPARRILFLIALLQVPALAGVAVLFDLPAIFVGFAALLLILGEVPIHDTIVTRHTRAAWRGRVFAVKFVIALLVAAAVPSLVGGVHEAFGFDALFYVLAAAAGGVALSALILPKARKIAR
ncbi:MFS transporter [Minwuia thermotolerans]|uniref:MFS transporter n=2 Tax=Minwuia thermotolerans TaxID=2056226 RepID=A0A2M9G0B2_9PROT|nr:MFS transporter [Minwuia thermotolerans]